MDKETLKMISELLETLKSEVETMAKVQKTYIEQQGKWTNGY